MLTKTLSEAKKKQRNILIKSMNHDIGSIDSAKDSWNPAQISEREKDISYIRSLVDSWNPAQLNEALKMLDLPVIDTWNPAQIEEQRRNLVFYLVERTLTGNPITLNILGNLTPEVTGLKVTMNPIQIGSGEPSPTNIRPISGRTEASVKSTGKNILNSSTPDIQANGITYTVNDDGTVKANGTATGLSFCFFFGHPTGTTGVLPSDAGIFSGENLILNGCQSGGGSSSYMLYVQNTQTYATVAQDTGSGSQSFSLDANTKYRCGIVIQNGTTVNNLVFKPMIRLSSVTDATYEPYQTPETKTHQYSDTIYGGVDDFVNGGATSEWEVIDLGDLNYTYYAPGIYFFAPISPAPVRPSSATVKTDAISSIYKAVPANQISYSTTGADGCFAISTANDNIVIRDTRFTSATDLKTALAGQKVCYPLATPTTIQTSAEAITLLKGENVLSTDGDSIELKYKQNF